MDSLGLISQNHFVSFTLDACVVCLCTQDAHVSPRASHSHSLACALGTRQLLIMMFLARCVYPAARAAALYQVNCADKRCCFVSAGGQDSYSARQVRAFHQGERRFRAGDADVTIEVQARPYLVFLVVMAAVFLSMNSRDLIIVQGQPRQVCCCFSMHSVQQACFNTISGAAAAQRYRQAVQGEAAATAEAWGARAGHTFHARCLDLNRCICCLCAGP